MLPLRLPVPFSSTSFVALVLAAVALSTTIAGALEVEQEATLAASDAAAGNQFGFAVALDGDTAVIGALRDDDNGEESGSAYVFVRRGGEWIQQDKLLPADGAMGDRFGNSVWVDGNTAIVGVPWDDDNEQSSGSAYVFIRTGGVWAQQDKLLSEDGAFFDNFGWSVALDGDTAVIGAFRDDDDGDHSGSAYVFVRTAGVWTQQAKLLPDDGNELAWFGRSVAVDGDTAIVGASWDDDNGQWSGSAYVFVRTAGVWTQQDKLLPADGTGGDRFGDDVALDGDRAVIGACGDDDNGVDSGSAYVFIRTAGVWTQEEKLLPADGAADDRFGDRVSLDGDRALIGAWEDDDDGEGSGSAYLFERDAGLWVQQAKVLPANGAAGNCFGRDVALDGEAMVIGASRDWEDSEGFGSAYVFRSAPSDGDGCPAEEIASRAARPETAGRSLGAVRAFRNEVLSRSTLGRSLIHDYYRHGDEVVSIMRDDPYLLFRSLALFSELVPAIESATAGDGSVVLSRDLAADIEELAEEYEAAASPELAGAIGRVRTTIARLTRAADATHLRFEFLKADDSRIPASRERRGSGSRPTKVRPR